MVEKVRDIQDAAISHQNAKCTGHCRFGNGGGDIVNFFTGKNFKEFCVSSVPYIWQAGIFRQQMKSCTLSHQEGIYED